MPPWDAARAEHAWEVVMHLVVIGMGYVGIPCAALLADVPGFRVTGVQRRSARSGWEIDALNAGRSPLEGDEPRLAELLYRLAVEKGTFRVTDDLAVCREADALYGTLWAAGVLAWHR